MNAVIVEQVGWWPWLQQPVHPACGWSGRVRNVADDLSGEVRRALTAEAHAHTCG